MTDTSPTPHTHDASRPSTMRAALFRTVRVTVGVAALLGVFWLGTRFAAPGESALSAPRGASTADVPYWTCSMHPQIRQDQPGQCPICGMDLVPGEREEAPPAAKPTKKPKYACSMFCVPPMERPGECPICGMDMVEVEEDDDGGEESVPSETAFSEITLSETARRLAAIRTAPVERRFVTAEIRMVGKVDYDETRQRTLSARVPGRLDRLFVDYTGVPVRQGDHLVELYSPELLAAQQELIQAITAQRDVSPGASAHQRAVREGALEAARQKLLLWGLNPDQLADIESRGRPTDHLTIYAPIGGIVTQKRLVEGAYVETGTEIYTIADLSHVWVKLDAYELDLAWLRYGQDVSFETEAYPGDIFHGTVAFIDPVLDARTRTVKIRVNASNADGRLKPGMFVRATVRARLTADGRVVEAALSGKWICPMHPDVIGEGPVACTQCGMPLVPAESLGYAPEDPAHAEPPLAIPATAPLLTGKRAVVYVAQSDRPGRFEGRRVRLGARAGDYYLVREGLVEGEQVVVHGGIFVDSAVQILGRPSMMSERPTNSESAAGISPRKDAEVHGRDQHLSAPLQQALNRTLTAYLAVHAALAGDQFEPARSAGVELRAGLQSLDAATEGESDAATWQSVRASLLISAEKFATAESIALARAAFEGLSHGLITLVKRWGPAERPRVLIYHCPMAFDNRGAPWLQETQGVRNPYFGAVMPTCGVLKESITPRPAHGGPSHGH